VTTKIKPQYPKEARERRIRGRVELQFVVNNSGSVGYVRVLRSIPVLDEAAVECIREWEFEPALYRNRPAPFILTRSITF
jgi:protein TonB